MLTILNIGFYLSAFLLCFVCIVVANSMDKDTCPCMKFSLLLILIGASLQMVLAGYGMLSIWDKLSSLLISLGISSWILFDQRAAHLKIDMYLLRLNLFIFNLKHWFKYTAKPVLTLERLRR